MFSSTLVLKSFVTKSSSSSSLAVTAARAVRSSTTTNRFLSSSSSSSSATFDLTGSFETYELDTFPNNEVTATSDELIQMFETMYTMRRMEITCDNEYKSRTIRGFCHLYDGQEAVATGIDAALSDDDSWITSYRCHCVALIRGGTVEKVIGELFGGIDGYSKGKGGSMHFYNKKHNFYGGAGIVGAQVPVGTGLAFANKYRAQNQPGEQMAVAIACYGDGAANQGQVWEAANMASLWKLPMIFCIENNHYGMGTSIDRHSSHSDYYKMGNHIPGIRIDGMNVLAVKEGMRFVKDYCGGGNGPMYVEMMTYRYHGHSMSDPGTTYRNREEIAFTRSTRDPLEFVKRTMVEAGFATTEELKETEKRIRKSVQKAVVRAKEFARPNPAEELVKHIYVPSMDEIGESEYPNHIRLPDYAKSYNNA